MGEKSLPADHPDLAIRYNNLARLYEAQGHFAEAEPLYKKALEILERKLSLHHPSIIMITKNLAGLLRTQGHPDQADALLKRLMSGHHER
jgi:tetratricopeptide (TPR) repeat protein